MLNRIAASVGWQKNATVVTDEVVSVTEDFPDESLRETARKWVDRNDNQGNTREVQCGVFTPCCSTGSGGTAAFTDTVSSLIGHEDIAKLRQHQTHT